ncbi:hypothetical protein FRB96_007772 [Tulasnella sp. 330]|nr:hypothetical protein FRB96_007772 [Tulasnella sp. 330]KAG8868424.1 hypothetical protein FRB97_002389 [Tulasnella sp. 331]KAG8869733.1 hypothetical protein FRB98_002204 [Tulasnella sp. 332]
MSKTHPLLLDIAGFPVESLVDDLLDIGADAVEKATVALESYLNEHYLPNFPPDSEAYDKVQAGLVSFSTLLESHLDKAFDAFEHWSLRNVFAWDPKLDIVLKHQKGLDLSVTAEQETKLLTDIDELRRKVDARKRLNARLRFAVRSSNARTARSAARLEQLRFLSTLKDTVALPKEIQNLLDLVQSLPPIPPPTLAPIDPTKRPWQLSHAGYMDWAGKTKMERSGVLKEKDMALFNMEVDSADTGRAEDMDGIKRI